MKQSVLIPIICGLLLALLLAPSQSKAEFFTGNQLLQLQNSESTMDKIQALGFVQGVFDVYLGVTICPPHNVTAGQVNDMVRNFLNNSPAVRHHTAESLINHALKGAWPCKKQNKGGAV